MADREAPPPAPTDFRPEDVLADRLDELIADSRHQASRLRAALLETVVDLDR